MSTVFTPLEGARGPASVAREAALSVSVVATVRNERATIAAFVDSLIRQTRRPEEIVIVDGKSTDGTTEILERYAEEHGITVISTECNIAEGRNIGVRNARGNVIAVTDAGCHVDAEWLEHILGCFARVADADVVAGNFKFDTFSPFEEAVVKATFVPDREEREVARYFPSSRSVAFRKSAWERAGGYPEWLYAAEDTLFNVRLRQIGCKFVFSRDAIVRWRPRETLRALAKQRFNFARGNARVGIGIGGYAINLQYHGAILALLLLAPFFPLALLGAAAVAGLHVRNHLWAQAREATAGLDDGRAFWRVLGVMEFVRLVNMAGFLAGRWDRIRDPSFVSNQRAYMGVTSADEVLSAEEMREPLDAETERAAPRARRFVSVRGGLLPDGAAIVRAAIAALALASGVAAWMLAGDSFWRSCEIALSIALVGTVILTLKSLKDFTQTGPRLRHEIATRFRLYTVSSVLRLALAAFAIMAFMAGAGVFLSEVAASALDVALSRPLAVLGGVLGLACAATLQFFRALVRNPGLLVASMQYRTSRLYPVWSKLDPGFISRLLLAARVALTLLMVIATLRLVSQGDWEQTLAIWLGLAFFGATVFAATWLPEARITRREKAGALPNIIMIGSDTLRADRLGVAGYRRQLTPTLDRLAASGVQFTECFVPCARTAPSLISLLTGTWPHHHGIRDNFVSESETDLAVASLPALLADLGYATAGVSDWCGADMAKFPLGFRHLQVPEDQWNVKYLVRQGPKDLRLFLSLFTHNEMGRHLLPELYYLGGVPLTSQVGRRARRMISRLVRNDVPFFLNVFFSTTHPPFASEYPYYTRFADASYAGESKFAMARLTDPFDIIRRQGDSRKEFDLDQIVDLYDGCVSQLDGEVGRMLKHIEACGIAGSTIVVVYSDHGMELFEHDTWGQGNSVRGDASAKIPLIVADPRRRVGRTCGRIVRSIDVAPTLLDLVGAPIPPQMDGVSLKPYLDGSAGDLKLTAFAETGIWLTEVPGLPADHLRYPDLFDLLEVPDARTGTLTIRPEYRDVVVRAKDRMIRSGRWKLTYQPTNTGPIYALYDIASDPESKRDVAAAHPEEVAELSAELRRWIEGATARTEPERRRDGATALGR